MKIIDLLNKITNGEEVPRIIKYRDSVFIWNKNHYLSKDDYSKTLLKILEFSYELNNEIEIIEYQPKKIEKMEIVKDLEYGVYQLDTKGLNKELIYLAKKTNEIIDYINSKEDK